jgi:integrase
MKAPKIELRQRGSKGVWWARYSCNGERLHYSLQTSDAEEAREEAETIKYEIKRGIHRPFKRLIFDNLLARYLEAQRARNAEKSYKRDITNSKPLLKAFAGHRIDDIDHSALEYYMAKRLDGELNPDDHRRKTPSKCTINHEVVMIKHMFNKAVEWKLLMVNPLRAVKLFRLPAFRPRYVTIEELEKIKRHACPELWDIIIFFVSTGMRPKEIFSLKWSDLDWPQRMLTVQNPKNRYPRIIPLNDHVYNLLLKRNQNRTSDFVFMGRYGGKRETVRTAFKAACRRAGIEGLRFYDLRKSFCTLLMTEGVDIRTVQDLSGHRAIESLEHYLAFPRMKLKRDAVSVIDRLLEKVDQSGPKSE